MRFKTKLRFPVCALFMVSLLAICPGRAGAQFLLRYTGDDLSDRLLDTLLLVDEMEEAVDANHQTIAGWLLSAAENMLDSAERGVPDAVFRSRVDKALSCLDRKKDRKALANLRKASGELQELAKFWNMQGAGARLAELIELLERGEVETSRGGLDELKDSVRVEPLRKIIDSVHADLGEAREKHSKRLGMETVEATGKAGHSLRRALVAARLTQVKIIVAYTRAFVKENRRWKAKWALWRGLRKLKKGSYLATEAEGDAIRKIDRDIVKARTMICRGERGAEDELGRIEAKIDAMLREIG